MLCHCNRAETHFAMQILTLTTLVPHCTLVLSTIASSTSTLRRKVRLRSEFSEKTFFFQFSGKNQLPGFFLSEYDLVLSSDLNKQVFFLANMT